MNNAKPTRGASPGESLCQKYPEPPIEWRRQLQQQNSELLTTRRWTPEVRAAVELNFKIMATLAEWHRLWEQAGGGNAG